MAFSDDDIIIGIDTGNRCIKTVSTAFVSGLKTFDTQPPFMGNVLQYNGKFFAQTNERGEYQRDKTKTDDYFAMSLIAIAQELNHRGVATEYPVKVSLGVGLPPLHLPKLKKSFKEYFERGGVTFSYNDRPYAIEIADVQVFAQGYAAIFADFNEIKQHPSAYIVDIGGYTTDVIALRYGKVDLSLCQTLSYGLIHMYNDVVSHIQLEGLDTPSESMLDNMLETRVEPIQGMLDILLADANEYANKIIRKIEELGISLMLSRGVFIGGGSAMLEEFIRNTGKTNNPIFIRDIYANACGYEAFMNTMRTRK